jgi:hypothetical protein
MSSDGSKRSLANVIGMGMADVVSLQSHYVYLSKLLFSLYNACRVSRFLFCAVVPSHNFL